MGWREEEGEEDKGEGEEQGTTMERQSRSCKIVYKKINDNETGSGCC
jgi:hypothetical protein